VIFSSAVLLFVVKVLLFSVGKFVGNRTFHIELYCYCKICSLRFDSGVLCLKKYLKVTIRSLASCYEDYMFFPQVVIIQMKKEGLR
jgi:hypothetical protein